MSVASPQLPHQQHPPIAAPTWVDDARQALPLFRRTLYNAVAIGLGEALILAGALMLGGLIRYFWKGEPMFATWMWYLVAAWVVGAYVAKLLPGWGLGPVEELRRTILVLVGVFAGTTAMLFWGKSAGETSRFTLTTGFLLSIVLIPLVRSQIKRLLIHRNGWGIPTAIYADEHNARRVVTALTEERGLGYMPHCVFSDHPPGGPVHIAGIPIAGGIRDNTREAPVAILAMSGLPSERVAHMLEGSLSVYRRVVIIPDLMDTPSLWVKPRDLVGMLGLEISVNLLDPISRFTKRTFDLAVVLLTAPAWVALCLVLGVLVWLEDFGNPLFRQQRMGRKDRTFNTWKFRTMHPEAERLLAAQLDRDPELRSEWASNFKLRNDPRITRVGAFLRGTSLDELPQFVNVLRGEMSLVGPRPLPSYHYEELPERTRRLRDRVRPGITGLWQVSGRSEAGHAAMPKWDMYYVRNWSIWLDIVILFRTVRAVLSKKGAF